MLDNSKEKTLISPLSISATKQYFTLCKMHKIINKSIPENMLELVPYINYNRTRETRQSKLIKKPKINLTIMKKSFAYTATEEWNLLPSSFKNNITYKVFKKSIKQLLSEST